MKESDFKKYNENKLLIKKLIQFDNDNDLDNEEKQDVHYVIDTVRLYCIKLSLKIK